MHFFEIFKISWKNKNAERLLPFESPERKPGWRFTARCHTETVAKRARRGGCTTMRRTMKKQFLKIIASWKCLGITMIVLKNILKFTEILLKYWNDFEISEFYRSQTFRKKLKIIRFLKIRNFLKIIAGAAPALRVSRAVTRLTVHRSLPIPGSPTRGGHN